MKKRYILLLSLLALLGIGYGVSTVKKISLDTTNTTATQSTQVFYDELATYYPQIFDLIPNEGRVTYTVPGTIQTATSVISVFSRWTRTDFL